MGARARARTVDDPGSLDRAAVAGREWVRDTGWPGSSWCTPISRSRPALDGIADDADAPVAVVVPDHHDDGNPVLALPSGADFTFAYGPGSCARHVAEAGRLRSRSGSCATARWASTSTTRPISRRWPASTRPAP